MEFVAAYGKEIVALMVPFITWFLNVGIKAKAKLIWASCDVSIGCSPGQVWETGVTTLQLHTGNPPDEQP